MRSVNITKIIFVDQHSLALADIHLFTIESTAKRL